MPTKNIPDRPDPDALLESITKRSKKKRIGRLYLFIGMAPGVGKTYAMLVAAHDAKQSGSDVVVGVAETHGREETQSLLNGLETIPKKAFEHRGITLEEMDLDAILKRRPKLVLIDELAHTNVPGSRHSKRWQDVMEVLNGGIDVFSTLNVQHLESRKEAVEQISGIRVRETVPDSMIDLAFQIRLIDLSAPDLLKRLKEGKVYLGEKAELAAANFFREEKLTALREIALRLAAEKVDQDLQSFAVEREGGVAWSASDRLLVGVGANADAEALIRTTRRLASSLDAPWIALHVDTGAILEEAQKARLAKILELARTLGGEVVTTTDTNIADAMVRIAKQRDITQFVIGHPKRSRFSDFFRSESLLDQLLAKSNIEVHVASKEAAPKWSWRSFVGLFERYAPFSAYMRSLWLLLGLSLLNTAIVRLVGYRAVGFIFLLGILGFGLFTSLGPVLFSAGLTAFIWYYFFIPPEGSFEVKSPDDLVMVFTYFITALVIGILARRISSQRQILARRETRSHWLYRVVWDLASSPSKETMITAAVNRVSDFLDGYCDAALTRKDGTLREFSMDRLHLENPQREVAVAKWTLDNRKPAGWSTETLQAAEALYIPLTINSGVIGVMAFKPKTQTTLGVEDSELLFTVARQLTVCLERESFREKAFEAYRSEETQKMHRAIIDLFSSDARSQLSVIAQSASVLRDTEAKDADPRRIALCGRLMDSSERLTLMFDNFVTMSRLAAGIFPLHLESIKVHELVGSAMGRLERVLAQRKVVVEIEPELPELSLDVRLCQQAIVNVLVNAAFNSPENSSISLNASRREQVVRIVICDEGPGVPADELMRIFEKFYRISNNQSDGVGLGLTVTRGVVRAHNGRISAQNRKEGGLCITIDFPIEA